MNSDNNQREARQGWQWGLDTENSEQAIRHAEDPLALMRMADDVITGKETPCRAVLEALVERAHRLPTEYVYRLAKRCPGHLVLASMFCSRRDAKPELPVGKLVAEGPQLAYRFERQHCRKDGH
jgi:hypothetical protein